MSTHPLSNLKDYWSDKKLMGAVDFDEFLNHAHFFLLLEVHVSLALMTEIHWEKGQKFSLGFLVQQYARF